MLGVAAITSVAYALTTYVASSESSELDAESKMALNNFELFGADYFLTDFRLKRSFDSVEDVKIHREKKNRRRRQRSNKEGDTMSANFRHQRSHLMLWPRASQNNRK